MMGKNIATTAVVVIAVLTCTTFLAPFGEAVNLGFGCSSSHHGQGECSYFWHKNTKLIVGFLDLFVAPPQ
jgi:hypothetical protein